ncbi:MAG: RsmB/NOP family class I SAM-dependent RNA methyltransferase [Pseudomonadota bacterium]
MTPGARVAAAIEILDRIADGAPAEQALTRWARASRFAGSGDRAAVRDHVFDVLRHWRSDAARGGGETGRARLIGRCRAAGLDLDALFSGQGHAPSPLSDAERNAGRVPEPGGEACDLPDWLVPEFETALGPTWTRAARALQTRAPVSLRVNLARCDVTTACESLAADGIDVRRNARAGTVLTVCEGARKLRRSTAFQDGLVELQDAASQAAVALIAGSGRLLDYCAGGGGKALALAARGWDVTAHDADPARMTDLPNRAQRGGHTITVTEAPEGKFDAVLCDAPCSGSGTWRRTPEAKWRLAPERLTELTALQVDIMVRAQTHVAPGGALYYATCSVLTRENVDTVARFCAAHTDWALDQAWTWPVDDDGDGFFFARLKRSD